MNGVLDWNDDQCCSCEVRQRQIVEIAAERDTLGQALIFAKQEIIKQVLPVF